MKIIFKLIFWPLLIIFAFIRGMIDGVMKMK